MDSQKEKEPTAGTRGFVQEVVYLNPAVIIGKEGS
jgi:hypothetical protein